MNISITDINHSAQQCEVVVIPSKVFRIGSTLDNTGVRIFILSKMELIKQNRITQRTLFSQEEKNVKSTNNGNQLARLSSYLKKGGCHD